MCKKNVASVSFFHIQHHFFTIYIFPLPVCKYMVKENVHLSDISFDLDIAQSCGTEQGIFGSVFSG